ncbi:glycosyltransferase family 39 protein [bacterium]|nr:glycosyltransferase family 39 protein [candidate division CSSED10-310 bacterium]
MVGSIVLWGLMAWITWDTWVEPFVDFGRELYVPWRISEGDRLFHDIAYFNGPVSPWWNALGFRLFGPSIQTLTRINLFLNLVFTVLLYRFLRRWFAMAAATGASIVFSIVFVFPHLTVNNAFNYIAPYSHEAVHSLYLSFAVLALAIRPGVFSCVGTGFCFGLVCMMKPETGVAVAGALVLVVSLHRRDPHGPADRVRIRVLTWIVSACAAVFIASTAISADCELTEAVMHAMGAWRFTFRPEVSATPFYRLTSGMGDPVGNSMAMVANAVGILCLTGIGIWVSLRAGRIRTARNKWRLYLVVMASTAVTCRLVFPLITWHALPRSLPVLLVVSLVACVALRRTFPCTPLHTSCTILLPFAGFGLLLLLKIILFARLYHYGFVLALPASITVIIMLMQIIPETLRLHHGEPRFFRDPAVIVLACLIIGHMIPAWHHHQNAFTVFESERGHLITDRRGDYLQKIVDTVEAVLDPTDTLAVLPQGVIINFLTEHRSSVRHVVFMPTELAMYGEKTIIDEFATHSPDFIILRDRSTAEHGVEFGSGYGVDLVNWIEAHYRPVEQIFPPRIGGKFGVLLLARDRSRMPDPHN